MSKEHSIIRNYTEGPLTRQLISFALPIMGANLLQALYTLVDLWVVGKFASTTAISAVSISGQIVFLLHTIGIGLGNGGQVLISQQVGAKEYKRLNTTIGTLLSACMLCSVIVTAIGAIGSNTWLSLMQTPDAAFSDAARYLLICCIGVPFVYGGGTLCAILRGVGDSKTPMIILGVSAGSNVVLDVLFVAFFRWGAVGAAWATIIAQILSLLCGVIVLYHNRESFGFDFKLSSFKIDRHTHAVIWKLSFPLVVMSFCITFSMMIISAFVNSYGVAPSAISGIGSRITSLVSVVTQSMQTAVSGLVAQNFAAGKFDRVRRVYRSSNLLCLGFLVIVAALALLIPEQIIGIFTQPGETEILALARPYMQTACCMYFCFCTMTTSIGLINGVGNTTLNLIIALLDGVLGRIGIAVLMGNVLGLGVVGFWWGNSLAALISVVLGFAYYFFGNWEKRSVLQ